MTRRELAALRDEIARRRLGDSLPPERKRYRSWATEKRIWRAKRSAWCVYCGTRIKDARGRFVRSLTCREHRDLPRLDPKYVFIARKHELAGVSGHE